MAGTSSELPAVQTVQLPGFSPMSVIAVPSCESHICRHRHPTRRTSLPLFPYAYPCDIGVRQTIKDISASHETFVKLFGSIENFLSRLDIYTKIPPTTALTDILVKIIVELLSTLALATEEVKRGRISKLALADVMPHSTPHREILPKASGRERH